MNLSSRDRRALAFLIPAIVIALAVRFWPESSVSAAPATQSVEQTEKRLARLREIAAALPAKETVLKSVTAELAAREKNLVQADTAAQAQAQVLQIVRKLATAEGVEIRGTEIGAVAPMDAYGSVSVAVGLECRIEQLINLLAALAAQPELISTSDLRVTSSNPKEKTVSVRLTLAGLVSQKLVPPKQSATSGVRP